jgi:hypothetical protein
METMQVIFQTAPGEQTDFEREYITSVLLRDVSHRVHLDGEREAASGENALIVYSSNQKQIEPSMRDRFAAVPGHRLLHLSNENLGHDVSYYRRARVVLRSYWDPGIRMRNTLTVPLGFQSGFFNRHKGDRSEEEREIAWAFVGQMKSHRERMCKALKGIPAAFLHCSSGWSSGDQMSVPQVVEVYRQTIFVPCPFGNVNPDSFRIMEGLEWGCIPVVVTTAGFDYYRYVFGDHPFIMGDDWADCAEKMRSLLADRRQLREKQGTVRAWYEEFLSNLSGDVAQFLRGEDGVLRSSQFRYQKGPELSDGQKAAFFRMFETRSRGWGRIYRRTYSKLRHLRKAMQ